ncbi:MAG TPA: hypothetical protein VN045_12260 [Microbacteriaceae bacterium]|jgi:hypothetical protein|nr:hypothetical protein [Microbacteriaceae bacterium]
MGKVSDVVWLWCAAGILVASTLYLKQQSAMQCGPLIVPVHQDFVCAPQVFAAALLPVALIVAAVFVVCASLLTLYWGMNRRIRQ